MPLTNIYIVFIELRASSLIFFSLVYKYKQYPDRANDPIVYTRVAIENCIFAIDTTATVLLVVVVVIAAIVIVALENVNLLKMIIRKQRGK